jgi:diketogulonate reductase-like aldo/keto reductase
VSSYRLAGVEVPRIGLGTNRLTPEHVAFVRAAVPTGVRLELDDPDATAT